MWTRAPPTQLMGAMVAGRKRSGKSEGERGPRCESRVFSQGRWARGLAPASVAASRAELGSPQRPAARLAGPACCSLQQPRHFRHLPPALPQSSGPQRRPTAQQGPSYAVCKPCGARLAHFPSSPARQPVHACPSGVILPNTFARHNPLAACCCKRTLASTQHDGLPMAQHASLTSLHCSDYVSLASLLVPVRCREAIGARSTLPSLIAVPWLTPRTAPTFTPLQGRAPCTPLTSSHPLPHNCRRLHPPSRASRGTRRDRDARRPHGVAPARELAARHQNNVVRGFVAQVRQPRVDHLHGRSGTRLGFRRMTYGAWMSSRRKAPLSD
jgi:hypothetical protein